jgi:hypothetical protein
MPIKPNYFIVGTAKAGTTSIFNVLLKHPEVYVPQNKETYYFGEYNYPDSRIEHLHEYKAIFDAAPEDNVCVEVSTSYLYSKNAAQQIKAYNPDARIIMILRNPVDRAFSHYLYKLKTDKEKYMSFEEALTAEQNRIEKNWPYGYHYASMGFYYDQVSRYLERFVRSNILILFFDDLKNNPYEFYHQMFQFLMVDEEVSINYEKKYNISGMFRSKLLMKLLNTDNILKNTAKRIVPTRYRRHVSGRLKDLNINRKKKYQIKPETRNHLCDLFFNDLKKLEALLDTDLSAWLEINES